MVREEANCVLKILARPSRPSKQAKKLLMTCYKLQNSLNEFRSQGFLIIYHFKISSTVLTKTNYAIYRII